MFNGLFGLSGRRHEKREHISREDVTGALRYDALMEASRGNEDPVWRGEAEKANCFYYSYGPVRRADGFYHIHPRPEVAGTSYLGWKLHVSVKADRLTEAFDILAPILQKQDVTFKVVDKEYFASQEDSAVTNRLRQGAQITIYLEKNGRHLPLGLVSQMICAINTALAEKKIENGVIPASDAAISDSLYVSLRNDKAIGFKVKTKNSEEEHRYSCSRDDLLEPNPIIIHFAQAEYCDAAQIGSNFNPTNLLNPYSDLLTTRTPFDPVAHFQMLPEYDIVGTERDFTIQGKIELTLIAYLRQLTQLQTHLSEQRSIELLEHIYSEEPIPKMFLKGKALSDPAIQENIKVAFILQDCMLQKDFDTGCHSLDCLYSPLLAKASGQLADFLQIARKAIDRLYPQVRASADLDDLMDFKKCRIDALIKEAAADIRRAHRDPQFSAISPSVNPIRLMAELDVLEEQLNPQFQDDQDNPIIAAFLLRRLLDKKSTFSSSNVDLLCQLTKTALLSTLGYFLQDHYSITFENICQLICDHAPDQLLPFLTQFKYRFEKQAPYNYVSDFSDMCLFVHEHAPDKLESFITQCADVTDEWKQAFLAFLHGDRGEQCKQFLIDNCFSYCGEVERLLIDIESKTDGQPSARTDSEDCRFSGLFQTRR